MVTCYFFAKMRLIHISTYRCNLMSFNTIITKLFLKLCDKMTNVNYQLCH